MKNENKVIIKRSNGREGFSRATIADIAKACDVSKSTVSRVLNHKTDQFPIAQKTIERVTQKADELGYRPNFLAKAIANRKTSLIGLSLSSYDHLEGELSVPNMFQSSSFTQYIAAIFANPLFDKYNLVLHSRKEGEGDKISEINDDLLDGLIYLNPSAKHTEFMRYIGTNLPVVLIGHMAGHEHDFICVDIDNRALARQAVEHLIETGKRRIHIVIPKEVEKLYCIQDRLDGYRDALQTAGLPCTDEQIHTIPGRKEDVNKLIQKLPSDQMDAIFSPVDEIAYYCIDPIRKKDLKIPEDIALFGFTNIPACETSTPTISSIDVPFYEIAFQAAKRLLTILEDGKPYKPGFYPVPARLIIRESSRQK
jgi:DNA-binding LacI/PurR family transcriptional regulator